MTHQANAAHAWLKRRSVDWWIETSKIAPIRLVLAATALLIIYIDPSEPDRLVTLTYSLLLAYTGYSALILILSFVAARRLPVSLMHWFDLIWYVALISTSSGTSSIFFIFFFFPVLVASFRWGFASGLRTTVISAVMFVTVGFFSAPSGNTFELNRFLLRSVTLVVLGYMIAHWGGSEIELKRRLNLLKDITSFSNPRFGIQRTIALGLKRLRQFYDAEAVALVMRSTSGRPYDFMRSGSSDNVLIKQLSNESARLLLSPEFNVAVVRAKPARPALLHNLDANQSWKERLRVLDEITSALPAQSFTSVPVMYRGFFAGRLYVIEPRRRMTVTDVDFLRYVIDHVTPLLDNIRLLDRIASDAADDERKKLARNIHDSVIQPYVGLQFGLVAIRQKLLKENSGAYRDVNELCEVANSEVRGLRHFLDELKTEEAHPGFLFPAVRRIAAKYSAATQITVEVTGEENLRLNDRLAAEVFQMITEALSNVRRHTCAQQASVQITCDDQDLIVKIANEQTNGAAAPSFRPRSICERVSALGGHTAVYADNANRTVVAIQIPL